MTPSDEITQLENYILALAYAKGPEGAQSPLRGRTALQKIILHFRKAVDSRSGGEVAHFYGPFDERVQTVLEQLETSGYLRSDPSLSRISLTERGRVEARDVWNRLPIEERRVLGELKEYFGDMSSDEILAVTYAEYPDLAAESLVRDEIARKGPSIALSLVRRGKVSPELGAKISHMQLREFLKYLGRHRVPVVESDSSAVSG